MYLLNKFNPFKAFTSSRDVEATEIVNHPPSASNNTPKTRRRLKRRPPKRATWQPGGLNNPSPGVQIPNARNPGFHSAPDLLTRTSVDTQSRPWSPPPTFPRHASPFREADSRSWHSYDPSYPFMPNPNTRPPPDEQVESPLFGPRVEALFQNEMPYDMVSPLSELAAGRRPPRYEPLSTPPDSPVFETTPDANTVHSREWARRPVTPPHRTESGTYYIVPAGANIVFQDAAGNEITRVGDFSGRRRRVSPIVVQDEHGRNRNGPNHHGSQRTRVDFEYGTSRHRSRSVEDHYDGYSEPTIIMVDRGRLIPIIPRNRRPSV